MRYDEAAALLGVTPGTPVAEARKEYLARARILHPDRYSGAPEDDARAASRAMAQLNEAWEVYQQGPQYDEHRPTYGAPRPAEPEPDPEFPIYAGPDFCEFCGWGPARRVKFNTVQGLILFWRWGTIDARLCRICAIGVYNESQRYSLTRGWWGIIAPLATIFAFLSNMTSVGTAKRLPAPQGRSPHAYALSPIPMIFTIPWYKRPLVWVSTGIVFAVVGWILIGLVVSAATPRTTRTTPSPQPSLSLPNTEPAPQANGVNTCWQETGSGTQLKNVPCGTAGVDWKGYKSVTNVMDCPDTYLEWDTAQYLCLVRVN